MYIPDHFKVTNQAEIYSFINANAFGQLISSLDNRLTASHLPFLLTDDRKHLLCHLARQNSHWQHLTQQQVLVTFQGPHDYISPNWYQTSGVPTWNYQAVHIYGSCRIVDSDEELAGIVEALTRRYESGLENPWQPKYAKAMLKAIVGVEIEIESIECKYKLSQNRPQQDHQGVVDQLEARNSETLASAMRKILF